MFVGETRRIAPGTPAAAEIADSQKRFERGDATISLDELRHIAQNLRRSESLASARTKSSPLATHAGVASKK